MKTRKGRRFNASPHIKRQGLQGVFTVFPVLPIPVLFGLDPELLIWVNGAVVFSGYGRR